MGLIQNLLGLNPDIFKLASIQITLSEDFKYHISHKIIFKEATENEYIDLILHYFAKVLYVFNPSDPNAMLVAKFTIETMELILKNKLECNDNIFKKTELENTLKKATSTKDICGNTYHATLYHMSIINRAIKTKIPTKATMQNISMSVFVLIQSTLPILTAKQIFVLQQSLEFMNGMYRNGTNFSSMQSLADLPTLAYWNATVDQRREQ